MISMCISCTNSVRKESPCAHFIQNESSYEGLYDPNWMTEHMKTQPDRLKVEVRFKFCPNCTTMNKPGFKPDVKKVCKSAEKSTRDCLGTFVFMHPSGRVINSWKKTEFRKMDPDMYMTTDTEATENDDDDDDDDDSDSDDDEDDEDEDEEKKGENEADEKDA